MKEIERVLQSELPFDEVIADNMTIYGLASAYRALPSNIDGLKLTQRRVLYTMYTTHTGKKVKCVSIVGRSSEYIETGDSGIYQALVNMGQEDRHINPLIESQGNFGYIIDKLSGFAAPRYTEAKLSQFAFDWYFTEDLKFTKWRPNYSETLEEPIVLPTLMPMGLVMGSLGIALAAANSVLPMSLKSVADSYTKFLNYKKKSTMIDKKKEQELIDALKFKFVNEAKVTHVTPDLLKKGSGILTMEGEYVIEAGNYGRTSVVITKLPYLTEVTTYIEKLRKIIPKDVRELLHDVVDESSKEGIRINFILKKGIEPMVFLDWLKINNGVNKSSGLYETRRLNYKYFSYKYNRTVEYPLVRMYEEHFEFKMSCLDRYFTHLIDEYTTKITFLEALLYIMSDNNRRDIFTKTIMKSDKSNLGSNLKKKFPKLTEEILLAIADRKFTVLLKNSDDIRNQIFDLKTKLNDAEYNRKNKIDYLIRQINEKVKKY